MQLRRFDRKRVGAERSRGLRRVLPHTHMPQFSIAKSAENDEASAGLTDIETRLDV
jgi:hypothetical protein